MCLAKQLSQFWQETDFCFQNAHQIVHKKKGGKIITHSNESKPYFLIYEYVPKYWCIYNFLLSVTLFEITSLQLLKKKKAQHLIFCQQIFAGIRFALAIKILQ